MTNPTRTRTRTRKALRQSAAGLLALAILIPFGSPAMATTATGNLDLTNFERQTLNDVQAASERMAGQVSISIPNADARAKAESLGYIIDLNASNAATNATVASGNPSLQLALSFDEARFNANSGHTIDMSADGNANADGGWYQHGLAFANGDEDDYQLNISTQTAFPAPQFPAGVFNPWVTLGDKSDPNQPANGFNAETGTYETASLFPSSSYTDGGVPNNLNGETSAESIFTQTWMLDSFASTEQRSADASLGGAQRAGFDGTFSDCINETAGKCGVWLTPIASGLITNADGSTSQGSVQIMESIWVEVTTTVTAQAPEYTEANPFVAESGDKVFFSPINGAAEGVVVTKTANDGSTSDEHNLLHPESPIAPWYFDETDANADLYLSLDYLDINDNGSDGFNFVTNYSSPFHGAAVTVRALPADTTYVEELEAQLAQYEEQAVVTQAELEQAQADYDAAVASGDQVAIDDATYNLETAEFNHAEATDAVAFTQADLDQARADAVSPGYTLTYDYNQNASYTPEAWLKADGTAYAVGETFSADTNSGNYFVDFTVVRNDAGELVFEALTSSAPPSEPLVLANRAEIGTGGQVTGQGAALAYLPGYEMGFTLGEETPVVEEFDPSAVADFAKGDHGTKVTVAVTENDTTSTDEWVIDRSSVELLDEAAGTWGKSLTIENQGVFEVTEDGKTVFTPADGFTGTTPAIPYRWTEVSASDASVVGKTAQSTVQVEIGPATPEDTTIIEEDIPEDTTIIEEDIPEEIITLDDELPEDAWSGDFAQEELAMTGVEGNKVMQLLGLGSVLIAAGLIAARTARRTEEVTD